ncbi:MAG: cell wall-binding repeat-containing protein [Actinomycetota bacterium]|nr:cell wall-binding repeat-containing protein [Actinomycetota bacterium]
MNRVRYFFADLGYWLKTHPLMAVLAVLGLAAVVVASIFAINELTENEPDRAVGPAPQVVVRTEEPPDDPADLGFPAFATANTTRVAGADSVAIAAGVALATSPAGPGVPGPDAVSLVDASDWASAIAAGSLAAEPVSAPVLLSDGEVISELTAGALEALSPKGSEATGNRQVFAIGAVPEPDGVRSRRIPGDDEAEIAARIAGLRRDLTGTDPTHLVIASSEEPEHAMPAAAWAARSGDPVLFTGADSVPDATIDLIGELPQVPIYLLGSADVISAEAMKEIEKATKAPVERATRGDDPVDSAIDFARYVDGSFGWDINDPGHGFVIASSTRPSDAGAAAALSATGTYGPLLLTDDSRDLPVSLEAYLLDLKPGYVDDPTRAVYNHAWIIGDATTISVNAQVTIDELVALAPIRPGQGETLLDLPSDSAGQGAAPNPGSRGNKKARDRR